MILLRSASCFASLLALAVLNGAPLLASVRSDERTQAAALNSYNLRTVIGPSGAIAVRALNGVVLLTGAVTDHESRQLAEETVGNLPGVDRVDNELTVPAAGAQLADEGIAARVRRRLLMQADVSALTVQVSVRDGAVTLQGTSNSAEQRQLTEHYVGSLGLGAVTSELRIAAGPDRAADELIDDASVLTQVKNALLPLGVGPLTGCVIRVREGLVMVSGPISSEALKAEVTRTIREVRGTRSVVNTLRVRG